MVKTDVINQKLDALTRQIEALQQENAVLRRDLGILDESIEALTGHGIDLDGQIVEIKALLEGKKIPMSERAIVLTTRKWDHFQKMCTVDVMPVANNR